MSTGSAYTPLFDGTTDKDRYAFLRREIVPRRDAVMEISAEIEDLNNSNLNAQQVAAAERQRELHQYLTSTLAASLSLGLVVAIAAVIRIRVLERRSGAAARAVAPGRTGAASALESAGENSGGRAAGVSRASCTTSSGRC